MVSEDRFRQSVRSGLAALVDDGLPDGPEWDDLVADDVVLARPVSGNSRNAWLVGVGVVVAVALLVVVVLLSPAGPSSTTAPAANPSTTSISFDLPPVTLGADHLWPETPSQLSPVELAELFVKETLGWETPGGTLDPDSNENASWVRVQQNVPVEDELVDVFVSSQDGGHVVVEVGTPWFKGADIGPDRSGGTRVSLLRFPNGDVAEVTLRLADGRHVVATAKTVVGQPNSGAIVIPDVEPSTVTAVLIRYVDANGRAIATNGTSKASQSLSSTTSSSAPVTTSPVEQLEYETYSEGDSVWIISDCPNTDQLLKGNPDGLPYAGEIKTREEIESWYGTGGNHRVIRRNGEAWDRDADGNVYTVQVEDFMIEVTIDDIGKCPGTPVVNNGVPIIFRITADK